MASVINIGPNQLVPNFQHFMAQAAVAAAAEAQSQQTMKHGETQPITPEEQEFVTVTRRKYCANIMIETAAFGVEKTSTKERLALLMKCLKEIAIPVSIPKLKYVRNPLTADPKPYFVFEVGHQAQMTALLENGHSNGNKELYAFIHMEEAIHVAEESRTMELTSIHPRTTADDLKAALVHLGAIEHIALRPYNTSGISRAIITFESAAPVEKLLAQATTGFAVGSDTCIIRRLGSTPISFDPALTLKLTNLPRGFTPYELNRILENQGTYFGIHIPFHSETGMRRPEAFIYFGNSAQQQQLRTKVFNINNKITAWLKPTDKTCYHCGEADHLINTCPVKKHKVNNSNNNTNETQKSRPQPRKQQQQQQQQQPQQQRIQATQQQSQQVDKHSSTNTKTATTNVWASNTLPHQRNKNAAGTNQPPPTQTNSSQSKGKQTGSHPEWKIEHDKLSLRMDTIQQTLDAILKKLDSNTSSPASSSVTLLKHLSPKQGTKTTTPALSANTANTTVDTQMFDSQEEDTSTPLVLTHRNARKTEENSDRKTEENMETTDDDNCSSSDDEGRDADSEDMEGLQNDLATKVVELAEVEKNARAIREINMELRAENEELKRRLGNLEAIFEQAQQQQLQQQQHLEQQHQFLQQQQQQQEQDPFMGLTPGQQMFVAGTQFTASPTQHDFMYDSLRSATQYSTQAETITSTELGQISTYNNSTQSNSEPHV